jgi:hypothetical protein
MSRCVWIAFGIAFIALAHSAPAGDKKDASAEKKAEAPLTILDAAGKEVKLKGWRLTAGTRRLPTAKPLDCLEFREEHSTTYQNGIVTLVPVGSLRKLDYDYAKKTVTAVVASAEGKDLTLTGTTRFGGINRLTIEGDADLVELGFAAVKFQGGNPKGGLTGIRFPNPAAVEDAPAGTVLIIADDKEKTRHVVADLTALYHQADGSDRLQPQLLFKKTVKLDLAKLTAMRHVEAEDKKQVSHDYEVTLPDGAKHTLTLVTKAEPDGGKSVSLVGLLGRVPAGYKLFPLHTVSELRVEEVKK